MHVLNNLSYIKKNIRYLFKKCFFFKKKIQSEYL